MLFEQVPEVFEIFFLQDFARFVLQEPSSGLLPHLEVKGTLISWLFEEEARNRLKRWIALFFNVFLFLEQLEELYVCLSIVLGSSLVVLALVESLQFLNP